MKRSFATSILIVALAMLFTSLGVLQYYWLKQISDANAEKERERVAEQTKRLADDFNRELQNAYFTFQADAESWKQRDWSDFNARLEYWRSNTLYPELISDFYFVPKESGEVTKYDANAKGFVSVTPPDGETQARFARASDVVQPIDVDTMTMYLPILDSPANTIQLLSRRAVNLPDKGSSKEPTRVTVLPRYGFVAIVLKKSVIDDQLFPALTEKHFPDKDYLLTIADGSGDGGDANARLYDLRPDNIMMFSNRELIPQPRGETTERMVVLDSRVESVSSTRAGAQSGKIEINVQSDGRPRTSVFTATTVNDGGKGTTVTATHMSGSIDTFMTGRLRYSLAIGLSLLLLTAGAVLAIIVTTQRARALAQRQIDFVSSVSHEFRTPLAVIYSAGENLADGVAKDPEKIGRYGEMIKGEGRKLSAMVEQILEFAGADAGRRMYKFEEIDVSEAVRSAVENCRPLIDESGVEVTINEADGLPQIRGDRGALEQAFQNLIVNAVKYGESDNRISIRVARGDGSVLITVQDRGFGIRSSDLKQIFEPFYRASSVVDAQIHGNGLGLALVNQIVDAHGGRVRAESEVGKGSRFTVELPERS